MTCSATDLLIVDLLHTIMENVDSVETLKTLKLVSKDFAQPARNTLCDVNWLVRNNVSLHGLLKQGAPTPALVTKLAKANPSCLHQRDGDGLLPLHSRRRTSRASAMRSSAPSGRSPSARPVGLAGAQRRGARPQEGTSARPDAGQWRHLAA